MALTPDSHFRLLFRATLGSGHVYFFCFFVRRVMFVYFVYVAA